MEKILDMNIVELRELLRNGETTSTELTRFYLDRVREHDGALQSYHRLTEELAMEMAREADRRIKGGEESHLLGIPFGIKDFFCAKGLETTCGSQILKGFMAHYDATVIKRLSEKHYVHLGRVNMDEFAMGSSTENSSYQTTRNPWDLDRIPGGSSGGSAAAVAVYVDEEHQAELCSAIDCAVGDGGGLPGRGRAAVEGRGAG